MSAEAELRDRRLSLAAVIAAVSVFGFVLGVSFPMLALALENQGASNTLIGLNGAMAALGIFLSAPVIPSLSARVGHARFLVLCLALTLLCLLAFGAFPNTYAWMPIRFLLGAAINGLFVISESWINMIAEGKKRGRIIGLYVTVLAAAFAAGPPLVPLIGVTGMFPYVLCALITALAIVPIVAARHLIPDLGAGHKAGSIFSYLFRLPTIMGAILLISIIDFAAFGLLPVYGLRVGLDATTATLMLTSVALGNVFLQFPIGWLADRINRYTVLMICALVGLVGSLILPFVIVSSVIVWPLLFVWGGMIYGLFTVSMVLMGERYQGSELVAVNGTASLVWGIGGMIGPFAGGVAMDVTGPHGLPLMVAAACIIFLLVAALRHPEALRRRRS